MKEGKQQPGPTSLQKLAAYFHADLDYLSELAGYKQHERRYRAPSRFEAEMRKLEALPEEDQETILVMMQKAIDLAYKAVSKEREAVSRADSPSVAGSSPAR